MVLLHHFASTARGSTQQHNSIPRQRSLVARTQTIQGAPTPEAQRVLHRPKRFLTNSSATISLNGPVLSGALLRSKAGISDEDFGLDILGLSSNYVLYLRVGINTGRGRPSRASRKSRHLSICWLRSSGGRFS